MSTDEAKEINRKLDIIMSAMGLTENRRLAPVEAKQIAHGIVLQYKKKKEAVHDCKTR